MIDKQVELWSQSSTEKTPPAPKHFISLKVVQTTPLIEDEIAYGKEITQAMDLGLNTIPEKPESLRPTIGIRYFNTYYFEVVSWSSIWDDVFDCEIIIVDLHFPKLGRMETINAVYSEKEWISILKQLNYEV